MKTYKSKNPAKLQAFEIKRVLQCNENGMPSGIYIVMDENSQCAAVADLVPNVGDYFIGTDGHFDKRVVTKEEFEQVAYLQAE